MSVTCQKSVQLSVVPVSILPDAYWTLDEAAGNRVDKVNSINLTPGGGGVIGAQPGLFSNGLGFAEMGAGNSNLATPLTHLLTVNSANGWSWCFWFKVLHWADPPPAFPWNQPPTILWARGAQMAITAIFDPKDLDLVCQDGSVPHSVCFQFSDNNLNVYCGNPLLVAIGAWNFAHVFFDPVAVKCGYQINAGPALYATQFGGGVVPPSFGALAGTSNLIFSQEWLTADTANIPVVIDEMLLKLSRILTPTEVTYLYNSGAGRTWPL